MSQNESGGQFFKDDILLFQYKWECISLQMFVELRIPNVKIHENEEYVPLTSRIAV